MLVAGYETTSTALGLASYELALNRDVQEKLQAEIDQHFPEKVGTRIFIFQVEFNQFSTNIVHSLHISLFDDSNIQLAMLSQDTITCHNSFFIFNLSFLSGFLFMHCPTMFAVLIVQLLFTELQTKLSNGSEDAVLGNVRQRTATTSHYCFIVCTCLICGKRTKYDVERCGHIKRCHDDILCEQIPMNDCIL